MKIVQNYELTKIWNFEWWRPENRNTKSLPKVLLRFLFQV